MPDVVLIPHRRVLVIMQMPQEMTALEAEQLAKLLNDKAKELRKITRGPSLRFDQQ